MSLYHLFFATLFLVLFALAYYLEGWKKLPIIIVELIAAVFCVLDYNITYYRGIGFVASDFTHKGALGITFSILGPIVGRKCLICIAWIVVSILVAVFGRRISTVFSNLKIHKKAQEYLLMIFVLVAGAGIAFLTDYPNDIECFRADAYYDTSADYNETWYGEGKVICHALGETKENLTLTNSLEALEYNYARGFRVFETDISFTSDGKPVLRHDWGSDLGQAEAFGWGEETPAVTEKEFLNTPIYGAYTPMNIQDLFKYMKIHSDMYVVMDTKIVSEYNQSEQYKILVEAAEKCGCIDVLSRVVVQLYYPEMYDEIEAVYRFDNYLLTLYVIGPDFMTNEEFKDFLLEKNIPVLTVPWYSGNEVCNVMRDNGIYTYIHTIDDTDSAIEEIARGFSGIYTNTIAPKLFETLYEIYGE